jgi:hypothetical protein
VEKLFELYDYDKDGYFDECNIFNNIDEFSKLSPIFKKFAEKSLDLNLKLYYEKLSQFEKVDFDQDGKISKKDFLIFYEKYYVKKILIINKKKEEKIVKLEKEEEIKQLEVIQNKIEIAEKLVFKEEDLNWGKKVIQNFGNIDPDEYNENDEFKNNINYKIFKPSKKKDENYFKKVLLIRNAVEEEFEKEGGINFKLNIIFNNI